MTRLTACTFLALIAGLLAGCGQAPDNAVIGQIIQEELEAERGRYEASNADLLKRVKQLEQLNADLQAEWVALKASEQTQIVARVKAVLDENVETMIMAKLDAKLGENADLSTVLRQTAQQEIVAFEQAKEAKAQAERNAREVERAKEREQRSVERAAQLADDLGLNDDQAVQLKTATDAVRDTMREAFTAMRESGDFDREKMRELMTETRAAHEEEVAKFLNEEQLKGYLERADRAFGPPGGRGGFGGGPGGGRGGPGGGR